jgi:hypothetical protein
VTAGATDLHPAIAQLVQGTSGEQRERLLAELLLVCTDEDIATMAEQIIMQDYGLPETPMMRKLREQGHEEGFFASATASAGCATAPAAASGYPGR